MLDQARQKGLVASRAAWARVRPMSVKRWSGSSARWLRSLILVCHASRIKAQRQADLLEIPLIVLKNVRFGAEKLWLVMGRVLRMVQFSL